MKYIEVLELARDQAMEHWYKWFRLYQQNPSPILKKDVDKWEKKLTALNLMIATEQGRA